MRVYEKVRDRSIGLCRAFLTMHLLMFLVACEPSHGEQVTLVFDALPDSPGSGYSLLVEKSEIIELNANNGMVGRAVLEIDLITYLKTAKPGMDVDWWTSKVHEEDSIRISLRGRESLLDIFYGFYNRQARTNPTKKSNIPGLRKVVKQSCDPNADISNEASCVVRKEFYATHVGVPSEKALTMSCAPKDNNPRALCRVRMIYRGRSAFFWMKSIQLENYEYLHDAVLQFLDSRIEGGLSK